MPLTDLIQFIKTNSVKSKRACFQLDDEGLDMYVKWAFNRDYLILVSDENGISGVCIGYPLPKPWDGFIRNVLPYDQELPKEAEKTNDLFVLDWIATSSESRKKVVTKFCQRFPNWENQKKWGIHYGVVRELSNKFMNKLKGIN